jgi:hypothetical protein
MANSVAMLQLDLADPDFHAGTLRGARTVRARIEHELHAALDAGELRAGTDPVTLATLVETTYHGAMIGWAIHRTLPCRMDARAGRGRPGPAPHRGLASG